ncbi:lytic murein transglycosylase [Nonomuraea sp. NPDC049309]|uniref:lytic transglycosylase domain-containing protein n=1 Tax=Nonomuraea sp. NPDC049309 TaxID=3364350 RepID=UPI003711F25E
MEARHTQFRRAPALATAAAILFTAACGTPAQSADTGGAQPAASAASAEPATPATPAEAPASGAPEQAPEQVPVAERLPAPTQKIPKNPEKLAAALRDTTTRLNKAIDAWTKSGEPDPKDLPEDVELLALYQQRLYRYAARNPGLAAKAFARLPAKLRSQAEDNTEALRELFALTRPIKPSKVFKVRDPRPAGELLGYFKKAERRFGVEWEVLAAVMFAETKFGRVRSDSHAGAQGPMQFMPATWRAYGLGGDVQDPHDAVMGAANYLKASGAPRDYRRALHAYNPSQAYVDAILLHARQIKRDPRAYYAYYAWQVFVLTTEGERRLTGP